MPRKKILGSNLKRLLGDVSEHGQRHLTEVEADLRQTELLLAEAVEKLTASFMAIHDVVRSRQDTIDLLLAGGAPGAEDIARLRAMSGEIGEQVNTAVTCMQFQDLTSQLLDRTLKRVTGLREFLGTLGAHGENLLPESGNEEIVDLLGKVTMALAIQSMELRSALRKAVNQQHLESGDIELF